jgi:putative ABC transport system permease protein
MLFRTALRIVLHEKEKFAGAVVGVGIAVFLMILQWGFYLGFQRDITVVLDSIESDIWIVPKNQPLFDGWVSIDDLPYYQAQEHPDVTAAGRVIWGYAACRIPETGGKDTVEVLGYDFDSGLKLNMKLPEGDVAELMRPDGHVLIGDKDREKLGIYHKGQEGLEIYGRKAVPVDFIPEVHLFTTAGLVVTDLDNARAFMRFRPGHVNYIVLKVRPGADVQQVVRDLQAANPEHDVLTKEAFHDIASSYWSERTGIGPVLIVSASLAVLVGFLIVMLAFYISTIEKIPIFACMKALGASNGDIAAILGLQVAVVFVLGCVLACIGLYIAVAILATTTISIVITPLSIASGLGATGICSAASSALSIRKVMSTDPGEAFRS